MDCFEQLQSYNEDNIILSIEEKERILNILKQNSILNIKKLLSSIFENLGDNRHEVYENQERFEIYIDKQSILFSQDIDTDNIFKITDLELDNNNSLIIICHCENTSDMYDFEEIGFSDKNSEYYIPLETLIKLEKALTKFV